MYAAPDADLEGTDGHIAGAHDHHRHLRYQPEQSNNPACYDLNRNSADWSFTLSTTPASSDGTIDGYFAAHIAQKTQYNDSGSYSTFWLMPHFEAKRSKRQDKSLNHNQNSDDSGYRVNIKNTPLRNQKNTWQKRIPRN